jgi:hypothetical protein
MEGSGRGLTSGTTVSAFVWRDREKLRKISVRIEGLWGEV